MPPRKIYFNGIDGTTGNYLMEPQTIKAVAKAARHDRPDRKRLRQAPRGATRGLPFNVDPSDVAKAGWGVVFHKAESADVKKKLEALLEHRRKTVTDATRLKVLDYESGETTREWLNRHEVDAGTVTPSKVPYYLLVIGSPDKVPFSFTQDLDAEYAVGRLSFDTPGEYEQYVASLTSYERTSSIKNGKEAVFFGTRHDFDAATQLSADYLVRPLATEAFEDGKPVSESVGFRSTSTVGAKATREALRGILSGKPGSAPPSLLFTATHGVGFALGDERQRPAQGALVCQDWPAVGQISDGHYLSAAQVPDDARVSGLVAIFFACYGAGTPRYDRFWRGERKGPPQIATEPFVAALPRKLLAHPSGGALACIGHVERAWGSGIVNADAGPQLQLWQSLVGRILSGQPIGLALKDMNERYASLSVTLTGYLDQEAETEKAIEDYKLAETWLDRNDAGGYILLGDPAGRLRTADLVGT